MEKLWVSQCRTPQTNKYLLHFRRKHIPTHLKCVAGPTHAHLQAPCLRGRANNFVSSVHMDASNAWWGNAKHTCKHLPRVAGATISRPASTSAYVKCLAGPPISRPPSTSAYLKCVAGLPRSTLPAWQGQRSRALRPLQATLNAWQGYHRHTSKHLARVAGATISRPPSTPG